MLPSRLIVLLIILFSMIPGSVFAQPLGEADRGQPGDRMIQDYLRRETEKIHARFLNEVTSLESWKSRRQKYYEEYMYMLGLWPLPDKSALKATITGSLTGDGFVIDMIHYQSKPQLYVTANLYRPAKVKQGDRLPAVLYVCGHSGRGRNGNKTAFQSHGMWFARHGYVCLVVDTLQLGEIAAIHHGTYRENRWWWHSRGYTSAGVECWNGVRGIDYLVSRADVDPERIAVTGISGGGASTFWVAAADERVKVAVPVSGMADLPSYVSNRVINGHCDCMFLHNTFQWPWTRIAAMFAPRPMLFINSDRDPIFPMDANERVINRLERLYSFYGAGDSVDSVVSIGGHAYREDIRKAAYRFINMHLKNEPGEITDSEVDLVGGPRNERPHPIDPEKLRVFREDSDIPADELNTTIDEHFVSMANATRPPKGKFASWQKDLLSRIRQVSFGGFPERIPTAKLIEAVSSEELRLESEPGIEVRLRYCSTFKPTRRTGRILLVVANPESNVPIPKWVHDAHEVNDVVYFCDVRGVGETRWTTRNPPNYVRRAHVLLGRTVDSGRIRDVAAAARYLHEKYKGKAPVHVIGEGGYGVLGAYAALLEPDIAGVVLESPPLSHMEEGSPQLLNVLRVCDIPIVLGMLAPKRLTINTTDRKRVTKIRDIYNAAGAISNFVAK